VARFRWEILRRTAEYQAVIRDILHRMAETMGWTDARLRRDCLNNGGVVLKTFGDEQYDKVCNRYGLTVLIHPEVAFSDDEMAAFPLFADTPARQPVVRDPARLRRVARRGGYVDPRTLRRIFRQRRVKSDPFQLSRKRFHRGRFEKMLVVFDSHVGGKPLVRIAKELGLSPDQTKRAWAGAQRLISKWVDFDSHLICCETCQRYLHGARDRMCAKAEQQIGLHRTGGSRLRPMREDRLALLQARSQGELPARRAFTDRGSRRWRRDG
jgi:hypothetical protein